MEGLLYNLHNCTQRGRRKRYEVQLHITAEPAQSQQILTIGPGPPQHHGLGCPVNALLTLPCLPCHRESPAAGPQAPSHSACQRAVGRARARYSPPESQRESRRPSRLSAAPWGLRRLSAAGAQSRGGPQQPSRACAG